MDQHNSPPQDDVANDGASSLAAGNGVPNSQPGVSASAIDNSRKRPRPSNAGDDDDDDEDSKPGRERRKIEIKFIQDKSRRHITFSKRKAGIMKKVRARTRSVDHPPSRLCTDPYSDAFPSRVGL